MIYKLIQSWFGQGASSTDNDCVHNPLATGDLSDEVVLEFDQGQDTHHAPFPAGTFCIDDPLDDESDHTHDVNESLRKTHKEEQGKASDEHTQRKSVAADLCDRLSKGFTANRQS